MKCNKYEMLLLVTTLESGKFKGREYFQACGRLKSDSGGHCCLGVYCDICEARGIGVWMRSGIEGVDFFTLNGESNSNYLPKSVSFRLDISPEEADISSQYGENWFLNRADQLPVKDKFGSWTTAAELNDEGYTYNEIALLLRKTYLPDTVADEPVESPED